MIWILFIVSLFVMLPAVLVSVCYGCLVAARGFAVVIEFCVWCD